MTAPYCCTDMRLAVTHGCELHPNIWDCPDYLVRESPKHGYGLVIHDGTESYIEISHCPWCGRRLTPEA